MHVPSAMTPKAHVLAAAMQHARQVTATAVARLTAAAMRLSFSWCATACSDTRPLPVPASRQLPEFAPARRSKLHKSLFSWSVGPKAV